ncbi:MAG: PQQ-like beta-propeller repeat protein, partial [Planctomycetales bacterium]|nr:PQQ-like beta-propeller repeat protein [Planctomycetales bacterium]
MTMRMFCSTSVLTLCLLTAALAGRLSADDWPLYRGDARSSGVASGTLPAELDVAWTFKVEKGAFEATPIIVDGVVYIGDLDGELYALKLADGKQLWKTETDSGFIAAPAYRDGKLFVGDFDGLFRCFDAKTGKQLWSFETMAEIDSSANFYKGNVLVGSQDATL